MYFVFIFRSGQEVSVLLETSWQSTLLTQPPYQWVVGLFPQKEMRPKDEAILLHLSGAELKNEWL
jgi:hypothetical protein